MDVSGGGGGSGGGSGVSIRCSNDVIVSGPHPSSERSRLLKGSSVITIGVYPANRLFSFLFFYFSGLLSTNWTGSPDLACPRACWASVARFTKLCPACPAIGVFPRLDYTIRSIRLGSRYRHCSCRLTETKNIQRLT